MGVHGKLLPLSFIRNHVIPLGANGKSVSQSTLWRWHTKGINGVRFEIAYCGSRPMSSEDAVRRFIEAVTAAKLAKMQSTEPELLVATDAELEAAGLI